MEENNENKNIENVQNIQQNVETKGTENVQEQKKKSGIGLTIVLVILIIALAGGIGYLTKMFLDGKVENGANNNVTNESKIEGKKIDESKPWVYDAEYIKENKIAYGMFEGEACTSDEYLKVPTININSEYANKANEEIKEMYNKLYNSFGTKTKDNFTMAGELSYEWYELDNLLSIAIKRREGVTNAGWSKEYFIYNINLDTLEAATYEEVYKKCGFYSENDVIENANIAIENLNTENEGGYEGTVINYGQYFVNKDGLNFLIPSPAGSLVPLSVKPKMVKVTSTNENNTGVTNKTDEKTTSQQDYSVFNSYKGRLYKNEDFNTTSDGEKEYCELQFDDSGKPTLKMGYKSDYNTEFYFQTNEIYNFKTEGAAGTTYASFDFSARTPGEDITGNAVISFSNVAEDYILRIDVTANYITGKKEYKNIEVNPIGQSYCESFEVDMLKNRVYESEKKEKDFWYKIEFDGNGKPTIIVGYYANEISQVDATYKRFTDVTCDNAAGSGYIIFSYRLLNETGDKVEGRLHYSNNTDNNEIYLKMYNMDEEIKLKRIK